MSERKHALESASCKTVWSPSDAVKIGLLVTFYLVLIVMVRERAEAGVSAWRYTHWLFNYEYEFVKRGLIGELFRLFDVRMTPSLVLTASRVGLSLFVCLLLFLLIRLHILRRKKELLLFGALVILCPFTLQHLYYDMGRFDVFALLISYTAILFIRFCKRVLWKAVGVSAALLVALLVHEASYFITVPLVLAYWFYSDRDSDSRLMQLTVFLLLTCLTALIAKMGVVSGMSLEEHLKLLERDHEFVSADSLLVVHAGGVADNIELTLQRGFTSGRMVHHLYMFVLLGPFFWIVATLFASYFSRGDKRLIVVLFAAFSPLALYPLGHDHFRWWSLAMMNLLFILLVLSLQDRTVSDRLSLHVRRRSVAYWLTVGLALPLGPVLVMHSFDFVGV